MQLQLDHSGGGVQWAQGARAPGELLGDGVCGEVGTDDRGALAQSRPVEPVASVAKRAEPLIAMGLADDGAGPDDFPTLAPCVASSTDFIQPAKGRGQLFCLGQGALAGGLTPPIDIENDPPDTPSTHPTPSFPLSP